jgi:hypothetical protein
MVNAMLSGADSCVLEPSTGIFEMSFGGWEDQGKVKE